MNDVEANNLLLKVLVRNHITWSVVLDGKGSIASLGDLVFHIDESYAADLILLWLTFDSISL